MDENNNIKEEIKEDNEEIKENVEEKSTEVKQAMSKMIKINKKNTWKIATFVLAGLLVVSFFTNGFGFGGVTGAGVADIGKADIGTKIDDFIQNNLVGSGVEAEITDISEEYGLYKFDISVVSQGQTQETESYATKDGSVFFIQGVKLEDVEETTTTTTIPQELPKTEKPVVELFVFSYCPYSLQFQKALLPVYEIFKGKVGIDFVAIGAMHGEYEKIESLRQICVEKEYGKDKLWDYLKEFMGKTELGDCRGASDCVKPILENIFIDLDIDSNKIDSCIDSNGAEEIYQEQTLRAKSLGISGSPTFVINGVKLKVARNPEAIKEMICSSFIEEIIECSQILSDQGTTPWFGYSSSDNTATGTC